jgi:S-adenosylmethionine:tRNA ribosyltransferase-isomerase
VGTTSLRVLETAAREDGLIEARQGLTKIFIKPSHHFRSADMLMTNFHLPKSTLFMLVCAFSGTILMKNAYAHAVAQGFRFYSYGDACLLRRAGRVGL